MTRLGHPADHRACLPRHLVRNFVDITDRDYKYADRWSNSLNLWTESIECYGRALRAGRQAGQSLSIPGENRDDQVIAQRDPLTIHS